MITYIEVDGYRSLNRFSLAIQPGLNILVGPNGAGKSNIISFFRFLSELSSSSIADAVSKVGGAGAVFQKVGESDYKTELNAKVFGRIQNVDMRGRRRPSHLYYVYNFSIAVNKDRDAIFFQRQTLSFVRTSRRIESFQPSSANQDWDAVLNFEARGDDKDFYAVEKFAGRKVTTRRFRESKGRELLEWLSSTRLLREHGVVSALIYDIIEVEEISGDLRSGDILNIDPAKVKRPEDSAHRPGISSDGSGVAATLYRLGKSRDNELPLFFYQERSTDTDRRIFGQIVSLLQLMNPSIAKVDVRNDPFDNQLRVVFDVIFDSESISLPFSSMSDGTAKWLSLVTAILTYRSIFAIEEPENFLHPLMQQEVINIMRRNAEKGKGRAVIVATHSETILNVADPQEVVVVHMKAGHTQAERPKSVDALREQIRESGFGLGYFYITGALEDA